MRYFCINKGAFKMMAKFVSSSNFGMEKLMPKDVFAEITFGEIVTWYLDRIKCFQTSIIERFEWNKKTKHLKVFTLNSIYEFELEKDTFNPSLIKCANKEKIVHYRAKHETSLHKVFLVRVLLIDERYVEELYTVETPISFYDARALLVGQEYYQSDLQGKTVQGKILHVFSPAQNL